MNIYTDGFDNWQDVVRAFEAPPEEYEEPNHVLCAHYDLSEPYCGAAVVAYQRGDKFYVVTGSHCSCYGLEESGWEPDVFDSAEALAAYALRDRRLASALKAAAE